MTNDKLLHIYLNDHLAAVVGGISLANRNLGQNRGSPLGEYVSDMVPEMHEHRKAIVDVLARLDGRVATLKTGIGWLGEKFGRLKLNGRLTGYSDLSRLEEIELMCMEAAWRRQMWSTLAEVIGSDHRLDGVDLERLAEQAASQLERLESFRVEAARLAFSRPPSRPPA
jgi:hypothetical protein